MGNEKRPRIAPEPTLQNNLATSSTGAHPVSRAPGVGLRAGHPVFRVSPPGRRGERGPGSALHKKEYSRFPESVHQTVKINIQDTKNPHRSAGCVSQCFPFGDETGYCVFLGAATSPMTTDIPTLPHVAAATTHFRVLVAIFPGGYDSPKFTTQNSHFPSLMSL